MGVMDRVREQAKQDMLPREGRDKWDPRGAQRVMCIWFPIMALAMCVVIGVISAIAGIV